MKSWNSFLNPPPCGGGAPKGPRGVFQHAQYFVNDPVHFSIHINIPETQNLESRFHKMRITDFIFSLAFGFTVLRAVNFNDQALSEFNKV